MVELRGRLSSPEVRDLVASVGQLVPGINSDHSHAVRWPSATASAWVE
jgi:hypothetical protein